MTGAKRKHLKEMARRFAWVLGHCEPFEEVSWEVMTAEGLRVVSGSLYDLLRAPSAQDLRDFQEVCITEHEFETERRLRAFARGPLEDEIYLKQQKEHDNAEKTEG